ncbi:hypothetical protein SAMN05216352_102410 [Alteribacillus bidgolensis]|uniref:Uncharacterized protein n=1 Tax=Alteribacillus bidgolensis TaxID=930129 RepID=A0A1G8EWF0_9BACI|nr:hypothetical protein SAMN05216352_102410 [Alteribacillus bidgolensis]
MYMKTRQTSVPGLFQQTKKSRVSKSLQLTKQAPDCVYDIPELVALLKSIGNIGGKQAEFY